jgi:hypothetical protein
MPRLSSFLGIVIYMYFGDHSPPHFHARYGKHEALIAIGSTKVIRGALPRPQLALAVAWALLNHHALIKAWELAVNHKNPGKIPPLRKGGKKSKK